MTTDIKMLMKEARGWHAGHSDDSQRMVWLLNKLSDALEAMAGEVEAYESARVTWAESMRAWINRATVAERERDRLKAALEWALGEGDEWPERKPGEGAFYWRAELRRKALGGDA